MNYELKIAQLDNLDEILQFEEQQLMKIFPDETERMFQAWNSRAREESLRQHLPNGWCFIARTKESPVESTQGALLGFFIAQPLLFFAGHTQSLWIEHLSAVDSEVERALCDLAYRLAREKHFQRLYLTQGLSQHVRNFPQETWNPETLCVRTSK